MQRIQNSLARIICDNFDYIRSRGIDLVIRKRRDHFLCVLMFKCIHGLSPHYLSNDVTMHVDIHGYDTRSAENMYLYIPRCTKGIYKRSILFTGSSLWTKLPPWVKESTSWNNFKHNFRFLNGWIHPEFIVLFICTPISYPIPYLNAIILSILLTASPIDSYPALISILSWYCCFYVWFIFMNMYVCVPYIYVFYFVTGQHERTV